MKLFETFSKDKKNWLASWEYNFYFNRCPGAKVIPQKA